MRKQIYTLLILILGSSSNIFSQQDAAEKNFEKFKQFYSLVFNYYMDTVNFNKLIETAITKSLENLDPHSAYLPPREASSENDRLRGNFEGIGIQYNVIRDTLNISDVIANGPSEKVGMLSGDKILGINDTIWAGKKLKADEYVSRLRGKKDTKVKVTILRNGKLIDFTITRDVIPLYSVDASFMINPEVGYLKLNKYATTTPQEVDTALRRLRKEGMQTLILDIQNNGGGLLTAAVGLADELLEKDKLIVYTEGLHSPRQAYNSSDYGNFEKGKIILLVNESSASASEITAGAIQDWDRGLIVGRRTYGKGLVQRPFGLMDNSQLRLTTAQYYTPSGRCIQKPFGEDRQDYQSDLLHRFQSGQLTREDTIKLPDSLMKYTASKRKVYGGGGITPDIYVPLDTSMNSEYYFQIFRKGILNTYIMDYASQNKASLLKLFPNENFFVANYKVEQSMINGLVAAAEKEGIKKSDSSLQTSRKLFEYVLKANLAQNLYGKQAFYKVIIGIDPIVQRALALSKEDFVEYKVRNE